MEENYIIYKNLTCCSVELFWKEINNDILDYYELFQREGQGNLITKSFGNELIYKGQNTSHEVINLKPNQEYKFTLKIYMKPKDIQEDSILLTTKIAPLAILSPKSIQIANREKVEYDNNLTDSQKYIIQNCIKIVLEDETYCMLKGYFGGIEIKIAHDINLNTYYISFDVIPEIFNQFFEEYIYESENNLIIPCHFIIQYLPTIFIFNLLEKASVIFTGKRMGGVIASSLAFYIMYIGGSMNIKYENAFLKYEEKSLGVVTFGSPSFLTNLSAGVKMKELTSYFYNIKGEYDFIPELLDVIKKGDLVRKNIPLLNKIKFEREEKDILNLYFDEIFEKHNLKKNINNLKMIPFGYYYMMKSSDSSLISIKEYTFKETYYFKKFHSDKKFSNLIDYKKLISKNNFTNINKNYLDYLENKNLKLEFMKIIRRNFSPNKTKGIIKFKLTSFNDNIISPDVIDKIILTSYSKTYIITSKDIFYDNDTDITAYIDDLNENINTASIIINFGGEIKVKHILNIQGGNSRRIMLKNCIEKLFLMKSIKN